jgi:hypothetical protein
VGPRVGMNRRGKSRPHRDSIRGPSSPPYPVPPLSGTSLKTSSKSAYRRWKCYLVQNLQTKCPELPLSADTVSRQLGDTYGDIEFSLRRRNITTKNFSLRMDRSADNRRDVKSSSIVTAPPLTSLSAMHSNYEPKAMKGRVADE